MNDLKQLLDDALSWLLLPASLYGMGGAILSAARKGKGWKQIALEGTGGVFVANMVGPLVAMHAPEHWHYTLYFLVGWCGLEGVGRLYEAIAAAVERRIQRRIEDGSTSPWNGVDRRKSAHAAQTED